MAQRDEHPGLIHLSLLNRKAGLERGGGTSKFQEARCKMQRDCLGQAADAARERFLEDDACVEPTKTFALFYCFFLSSFSLVSSLGFISFPFAEVPMLFVKPVYVSFFHLIFYLFALFAVLMRNMAQQ